MDIRSLSEEFTALLEVRSLTDVITTVYTDPYTQHLDPEKASQIADLSEALRSRMEERILVAAEKPEDYLPTLTFHLDVKSDLKMLAKARDFASAFRDIVRFPGSTPADQKIYELANLYLQRVEERLQAIARAKNLNDYLPDGPKPAKKAREL